MPTGAEAALHEWLARRRDRLWLVALRAARVRELARREVAAARWHIRRARRLLTRGVPGKQSTGAQSLLRLRSPARGVR
jgi:hypothetical protein